MSATKKVDCDDSMERPARRFAPGSGCFSDWEHCRIRLEAVVSRDVEGLGRSAEFSWKWLWPVGHPRGSEIGVGGRGLGRWG